MSLLSFRQLRFLMDRLLRSFRLLMDARVRSSPVRLMRLRRLVVLCLLVVVLSCLPISLTLWPLVILMLTLPPWLISLCCSLLPCKCRRLLLSVWLPQVRVVES